MQLHQLLHGKPNQGIPKGIKYKEWEGLWKHLQEWVRNQFKVELYLTEGSQKYVWYPISQCLISKYDEHILHGIFKEMDMKPGAYLAESQLLNLLSSGKLFQKLSVKIRRPIDQQKTAEIRLILGQIQLLLENWDGEVTEKISRGIKRQSPNRVDVQLRFKTSGDIDEIRYWFRCRQGSKITFKPNALGIETLQPLDEQWFEPFVMHANYLSFQVLQNGIELKSEEIKPLTFRLKSSEIWVFRCDPDRDNGWLSQGNLLLHEEHCIVYREKSERKVTSFLQQICDDIPISKPIRIAGKETGWRYIKIEPTALSDSSLLGFRVTTLDRIRFVGGLPLDRRSNSYFDFCLPTIVVPNLIADSNDPFYMNGQAMDVPSDRKIAFLDKLDSGEHHFLYLDCQSTLRIISPKRSLEHEKKTLTAALSKDQRIIPTYSVELTAEIMEKSGSWIAGATFFGTDIPEVTWGDVQDVPREKLSLKKADSKLLKSPAQLISSVVKIAIELKRNKASVPEGFDGAIKYLDENIAIRTLVQKKLQDYYETALSYADLRKYIGR